MLALGGPPLILFTLVSLQTDFSKHLRYVLPILPFLFVMLGAFFGTLFKTRQHDLAFAFLLLLTWAGYSSIRVCPVSLTYFNELAGGPQNGYRHLLGSNLDWGQSLIALKKWNDARTDHNPLYVSYSGLVNPVDVGIDCRRVPAAESELQPGWYAISLNHLYLNEFSTELPPGIFPKSLS